MHDRAFVFGYGSLTLLDGVVAGREPRPEGFVADLTGLARTWGVAMDNRRDLPGYKYYVTASGARPELYVCFLDLLERPGATVNGVCIPVDAARLAALDRRERNYTRVDVSDRVQARGARVWTYVGSAAARDRFAAGRAQGRAVISAGYLRQVQAGFWRIGEDEYEACRPSLDPGELPVIDLTRVDLAPPAMSGQPPPGRHDITTPRGAGDRATPRALGDGSRTGPTSAICDPWAMELGRIGVWTSHRTIGADNAAEAARLVETLGYGAFWLGGSPEPEQLRPILAATERIVAATGIVNVWQSEAESVARQHAALSADFPGRVLLGVGIGHPEATSDYTRPLTAMRAFIDGLDAADPAVPAAERCIAALSPKMLALSRDRSWGTHPYFVPVEHSRYAREHVGPDALVATELACVLDGDRGRARAMARRYAKLYLGLTNYTRNLLRFGFTEDDIADGGSDRLIDAVVPQGGADEIAAVVNAHLDAGADHICLQPITGQPGIPAGEWRALAAALGLG